MDIIETFAWITQDYHNLQDLKISDLRTRDLGRTGEQIVRVYGVSPRLFESSHNQVIKIDQRNRSTGLSLGEQLYTARGS